MTTPNPSRYNRDWALRLVGRSTGRKLISAASVDLADASSERVEYDKAVEGVNTHQSANSFEIVSNTEPYADNDDVWRIRFVKRGMSRFKRRIKKFFDWLIPWLNALRDPKFSRDERRVMFLRFRTWTDEELDTHRRAKAEMELFEQHRKQAKLLAARIVEVLTSLRFCYFTTKNERIYVKKKVSIGQVDISPYAYTFHFKLPLPFGVKATDVAQEWVSNELSATTGKKIRLILDPLGLRITVEVGSSLSIPNFVSYGDEAFAMPEKRSPLTFFAGLSTNGIKIFRDLAAAPHLLIAGETGGGKSNIQNVIACTFVKRNEPWRIRLIFFDLKGGVEFSHFDGVPHLWTVNEGERKCDGIIERPQDVMAALHALNHECNHRLAKLKAARKKNIQELNRGKHFNNWTPFIVVFFDEWAVTKTNVPEAETLLTTIANLSRAAGIHFILSTQYPKAEILNTVISINFPWRFAFNMQSGASQSVLGNWDAVGLNPSGRAVLKTNDGFMQVQTPRITERDIAATVQFAKSGKPVEIRTAGVDEKDVLTWALDNHNGKLDLESAFNQFKEKITQSQLRDLLRSMEGRVFDVHDTQYKVVSSSGNLPRRMELWDEMEMGHSDEAPTDNLQPAEELEVENAV